MRCRGSPDLPELLGFCADKFGWKEEYTNQVMAPVIAKVESTVVQARIDQYASFFHRAARIRSKRIAKVMMEMTGGKAAADHMLAESASQALGLRGAGIADDDASWYDAEAFSARWSQRWSFLLRGA